MAPTRGAARHHAVRRSASPSAFSQPPWLVHARARAPAGCGGWTGDLVRVPGTDWLMMQAGSQPAAAPPSLNCVSLVSCLLFGRRAALLLTATLRCARPGPRTQAVPRPRKGPVVRPDAAYCSPLSPPWCSCRLATKHNMEITHLIGSGPTMCVRSRRPLPRVGMGEETWRGGGEEGRWEGVLSVREA